MKKLGMSKVSGAMKFLLGAVMTYAVACVATGGTGGGTSTAHAGEPQVISAICTSLNMPGWGGSPGPGLVTIPLPGMTVQDIVGRVNVAVSMKYMPDSFAKTTVVPIPQGTWGTVGYFDGGIEVKCQYADSTVTVVINP